MSDCTRPPLPSTGHMSDYDANSAPQDTLVRARADRIADLVARIGPRDGAFVIQDHGCGPGHSAIDAVRPAIEAYRALSPDGPVTVRHSDQPGNDWTALMALVFGPDGYHDLAGVRTETVVGSFYGPLAAPGSIALATAFTACHWLSRALHPYSPGSNFFDTLEGEARAAIVAQGHADWLTFLRHRAAELMPGGYLMVGTLGVVPDPTAPNGLRFASDKFLRVFEQVAETMAADGLIDRHSLDRFVLPNYFLSAEEARAPMNPGGPLADVFEVVEASVRPIPVPHDDLYSPTFDDAADFGRRAAGYVRGYAESSLRLHLFDARALGEAVVNARIDEFFRRYATTFPTAPGRVELLNALFIMRRRRGEAVATV